ncbi:MAG: ribonuclease III domain-containing protein [Methanomicrobiaceae archaeon]|nr:ribonuclease III domain-containing protein [Methanomicrobiaceae archaeon]
MGYSFTDPRLLTRALTRLAYAGEQGFGPAAHMDALATLGDAVIDVVVIQSLVAVGEHDKGLITTKKTNCVNMTVLRRLAEQMSVEDYVYWGKGEEAQAVWRSGRVLAECMEALIGAVYLDGGIGAASQVLETIGLRCEI